MEQEKELDSKLTHVESSPSTSSLDSLSDEELPVRSSHKHYKNDNVKSKNKNRETEIHPKMQYDNRTKHKRTDPSIDNMHAKDRKSDSQYEKTRTKDKSVLSQYQRHTERDVNSSNYERHREKDKNKSSKSITRRQPESERESVKNKTPAAKTEEELEIEKQFEMFQQIVQQDSIAGLGSKVIVYENQVDNKKRK